MNRAAVTETAVGSQELRLGLGLRDASATVVGFCVSSTGVPRDIPALVDHGSILEPVGGLFATGQDTAVNYVYYPATSARKLQVVQRGRTVGTLRFGPRREARCPLRATGSIQVVACGAIVVVEWASPLRLGAGRLELLEAESWESGKRARQLGFFLLAAQPGSDGLVLRFGFRPPRGEAVSVAVSSAYVQRGRSEQIAEITFAPPFRTRFALREHADAVE